MGLRSRRSSRVLLLTQYHRRQRLQWAPEHSDWTLEELPGRMNPDFYYITAMAVSGPAVFLANSCSLLVPLARNRPVVGVSCCGGRSHGSVVVVQHTMRGQDYLNIIADQLHPFMVSVFPMGNGIFQQDNAQCHKASIVLQWFNEHADEFQLMSWPPNSPDINPIEHIWDVVERQLRARKAPPRDLREFLDLCLDIWYNLPPDTY